MIGRFSIHVLDLTQIQLADREDRDYDLDKWAGLFRALTWEDFKMISAGNKSMQEAGKTLFMLNGDDRIRNQCEAREDYCRTWGGVERYMDEMQTEMAGLKASNEELETSNIELKSLNKEKDSLIASLEARIAQLQQQLQGNIN